MEEKDKQKIDEILEETLSLYNTIVMNYQKIWEANPGRANSQVISGLASLLNSVRELYKLKIEDEVKEKDIEKIENKTIKVKDKLQVLQLINEEVNN